jgi:hypothetical protein
MGSADRATQPVKLVLEFRQGSSVARPLKVSISEQIEVQIANQRSTIIIGEKETKLQYLVFSTDRTKGKRGRRNTQISSKAATTKNNGESGI